ncbi:MAG: nucleotide exchange factor GrpE [Arenimonas sp.]|nr:nucleotide exchange factor GrpE [Arenimonas sp.]
MQSNNENTEPNDVGAELELDAQQQLLADFEQLKAAVAHMQEERLRERAELENQRKRLVRDVDMARKFANERLLGDLLPVFDSLDAGLAAAGTDASPLRDGLDLTFKQLLKVANENGLQQVDPLGLPFNPDQHQAISRMASANTPDDVVIQVFQKGYLLNERLLRPALVVVSGS